VVREKSDFGWLALVGMERRVFIYAKIRRTDADNLVLAALFAFLELSFSGRGADSARPGRFGTGAGEESPLLQRL